MGMLRTAPFVLPGSYGLNLTDDIANDQAFRFAASARNGVVDASGKLVARKDFNLLTSGSSGTFEQIYRHRKNDGTETILSVAAGKVYSGTTTLTQRYDYSATSTTANSPQFASLTSRIFIFQAGVAPVALNESTYATVPFVGAPWSNTPNCVMAAYGRLWAADDAAGGNSYTLWWANILDGVTWNAGDAGAINLQNAFPSGQDSIVAIAAAFGRIIIFGRSSILMYTLPSDNNPSNMVLTHVVENIGCTARDSVLVTDDGVYFLSRNGVYKIDKLAQTTSLMDLPQMSRLVNDDLIALYASETMTKVRAGYNPNEGWYVLNAPTANRCWVFNTRRKIPQMELPIVTDWDNVSMPFRAFCYDKDGNWYCAGTNGVYKYNTYTPDGANSAYSFVFAMQWNNGGDESRLKHLKYVVLTLYAANGQTGTFQWLINYMNATTYTAAFMCSDREFPEDPGLGEVKIHIGRSCNTFKLGFTAVIGGDPIEIHQLRLSALTGKTQARQ